MAHWKSHLDFLNDCLAWEFVPRGLRLHVRPQSEEERRWKAEAEWRRVRATRKAAQRHFYCARQDIGDIYIQLRDALNPGDLAHVTATAQHLYRRALEDIIACKARKFDRLLLEVPLTFANKRPRVPPPEKTQTVINLTGEGLSKCEMEALSVGPKFSYPPPGLPTTTLAVRCQYAAERAEAKAGELGITGADIAHFYNRTSELVSKASKSPFPSPSLSLSKGLSSLAANTDRVVVSADKARALVVLWRRDYSAAILRCLQLPIYEELPSDPSPAYNSRYGEMLLAAFAGPPGTGNGNRDLNLRRADPLKHRAMDRLRRTHGRAGPFYGLIKTHKYAGPPKTGEERRHWVSTLKLRPICPGYRSCDAEMAKHLNLCLTQLPRPPLSIQSPMQVLELLQEYNYAAGTCWLLSLDVEAMFPSIPVEKAIPLIRERFSAHADRLAEVSYLSPDSLADFLSLSISNTHAVFNDGERDRWWVQRRGLAMGKSFSPLVADQFMGAWEDDLKGRAEEVGGKVVFACRFADDYLVAFEGSPEAAERWLESLNSKEEAISVTMEVEAAGYLPFLDIAIQRTEAGFQTSVFRKACNTGQTVPFASYTDSKHLYAAIRSDTTRAVRYCKVEGVLRSELDYIRQKYLGHGYPTTVVNSCVSSTITNLRLKARALPAPPDPAQPPPLRVSVPYCGPLFHALRREARKIGVQLVTKPASTVGSKLCSATKHKLPLEQRPDSVYAIHCDCGGIYVGESGRELGTRVAEHVRGWRTGAAKSAFGTHQGHQPAFDNVCILDSEPHARMRLLAESAQIRIKGQRETIIRSPNDISLNRNSGTLLKECWLPALLRH